VEEEGGKMGEAGRIKWDPHTTGERPPVACWSQPYKPALSIFSNILNFFWSYEELPGILGEWVYNTPIF
jgi:hypothetical protein